MLTMPRCESVIRRSRVRSANTNVFNELPEDLKANLLSYVPLDASETPVVASLLSNENWILVTSTRLIWRLETFGSIAWSDVKQVGSDEEEMLRSRTIKPSTLVIERLSGGSIQVSVDPECSYPFGRS